MSKAIESEPKKARQGGTGPTPPPSPAPPIPAYIASFPLSALLLFPSLSLSSKIRKLNSFYPRIRDDYSLQNGLVAGIRHRAASDIWYAL